MAECFLHPKAPRGDPCARCGDFTPCPHCVLEYAGARYCSRRCIEETVIEREPPWESGLYRFGTWRACRLTVAGVIRDPAAFFARTPAHGTAGQPIGFFAFAVTIVGSIAATMHALGLGAVHVALGGGFPRGALDALALLAYALPFALVVFLALTAATSVVIAPARPRLGFDGTARVLAYAWGTAVVLSLGSVLGLALAPVVVPRAVYHGLRVVQGVGPVAALAGALVAASPFAALAAVAARAAW